MKLNDFLLLFYLQIISAIKIYDINKHVYVLPKAQNFVKPFSVQVGVGDDDDAMYTLDVRCSGQVDDFLVFEGWKDICSNFSLVKNLRGIAGFLDEIQAGTEKTTSSDLEFYMDYSLFKNIEDLNEDVFSMRQTIIIPSTIPFTEINSIINYREGIKNQQFFINILEFDSLYLKNSSISNFEFIPFKSDKPAWLKVALEDSKLTFSGLIDESIQENSIFFYIIDNKTDLKTKPVTIFLKPYSYITKLNNKKNFIFLILSMVFFLVALFAYFLYIRKKKALEKMKRNIERVNRDIPKNVLSDSILNWNRKLIMKHRNFNNSTNNETIVVKEKQVIQRESFNFEGSFTSQDK